tara:strand:- start:1700 stop:2230 length:531 start_codon:yes stop_codon:yes gene_type:complete
MQLKINNIILVGPMGSGKTTIGKRLSESLSIDFFDSDHEIIDTTGVSVDHIFDIEGEKGFRVRETEVLKKLCNIPNIVLATGGGSVLLKENRKLMKKSGLVVYLASSVDQILRRTEKSKTRPLLEKSTNKRKTITEIIEVRNPFYKEVATLVINTNEKKLNKVIDEIMESLPASYF